VLGEVGQVPGQGGGGHRQGDGAPAGLGLGRAGDVPAVNLGDLLGHAHPAMQ
jgi:hypothetical protein